MYASYQGTEFIYNAEQLISGISLIHRANLNMLKIV